MIKKTKEMKHLIRSAKETKEIRYQRVSNGIRNRSTIFVDRKKKSRKDACRKSKKGGYCDE